MRKPLLAGAAIMSLAFAVPFAAQANEFSWGNKETTYFYTPGTSADYAPGGQPRAFQFAPGEPLTGGYGDEAPPAGYRPGMMPGGPMGPMDMDHDGAVPGYYPGYQDDAVRGQGSGMDDEDAVGR